MHQERYPPDKLINIVYYRKPQQANIDHLRRIYAVCQHHYVDDKDMKIKSFNTRLDSDIQGLLMIHYWIDGIDTRKSAAFKHVFLIIYKLLNHETDIFG